MPSRPTVHLATGARPAAVERVEQRKAYDAQRRRHSLWRAWYGLKAWRLARAAQLVLQPLCERHLARGEVVPATVVNHRLPHQGDWQRFIDPANHESTCKPCHDRDIQREEAAQRAREHTN